MPPNKLIMQLSHEDVNLGYFEFVQHRLKTIMSGDLLMKVEEGYATANGDLILKFSKKFIELLIVKERNGFKLKEVKVEISDKLTPQFHFKLTPLFQSKLTPSFRCKLTPCFTIV